MKSCAYVYADVSSLHRYVCCPTSRSAHHHGGLEAGQPRSHFWQLCLLHRYHIRSHAREPALEFRLFRAEPFRIPRHYGQVASPLSVAAVSKVLVATVLVARPLDWVPAVGAPSPVGGHGGGAGLLANYLAGRGRGAHAAAPWPRDLT